MIAVTLLSPVIPVFVAIIGWVIGGFGMGLAYNATTAETFSETEPHAIGQMSGAAFTAVINAVVQHFITPLIAAIAASRTSTMWVFTLNNAEFRIGAILTQAINFLLVAVAVYFIIVVPINRLYERRKRGLAEAEEVIPVDIAVLREIRDELRARGGANS